MTYSIIPKSHLEGALRLDPEYYQPEYLDLDKKIGKFKNTFLGELMSNFGSGFNLSQVIEKDENIPYIRTQNVRPVLIDDLGLTFIKKNIKYVNLDEGDILAVRVGEGVGNSSIVTPNYKDSAFSDNVIRFKIKKINPYFVSIFLNCKVGRQIMERVSKGTARSLISKENFDFIKIPELNIKIQKYCEDLVLKSTSKEEQSKSLYSQAEDLLLEELGIKNLKSEEDLTFSATLKDCLQAGRIDADFFQLKYDKILGKIKVKKEKLSDLVTWQKGIEPGSDEYAEEGKPFIRVSNMSKFGLNDNNQQYLSEKMYNELKDKYQPQKGDILLSKDATPGIAVLLEKDVEGIISGGTLRLKIKDKTLVPQYLSLVLNSVICQMQIERDAGGSIIIHWRPDQVENTIIPILPLKTQQKIADLVNESFKLRREAKELLEEAKKRVEEEIEKGK